MTKFTRVRFWDLASRWRELLRDRDRPHRTAFAFALGAWIGATPILGVHTWIAVASAGVFRLPPLAVVLGSNLSNPITFIPLTLLEVRIGSWLLGREFHPIPGAFTVSDVAGYVLEAWTGWSVVGAALGLASYALVAVALLRARARRQSM